MTRIRLTMNRCADRDILADIIGKHRNEVFNLLLNEFDIRNYERCVREEGRAEGIAEATLELLEETGELPDSLRNLVMGQTDIDVLRRWHKLAARAGSIEDFEESIGIAGSRR